MDTPSSMLHVNHSTTHHQSSTQLSQQQQQQHLQLNISSSNQQSSSTGTGSNLLSSVQSNMGSNHPISGGNAGAGLTPSKNLPQMPPLSAVAYSHLHSVIGSMPIYDMGDYQHL